MVLLRTSAARSPFVLIPEPFGSLIFERCTGRYLPFDAEATQLLLCLASAGVDHVIASTEDRSRRMRIARFYETFYALGFFTLEGRFAGHVLETVPPVNHLTGPLAVHLEVSDTCNLRCQHCFAGDFTERVTPLGLAELDRLFEQMAAMGSYRLGLTGGEPLLREDLFEIIDLALAHGLAPCVTTNGMLLDEATAREFGRRELLWLNVSLEGGSPATNDLIRGRGSFQRVMRNVEALAQYAKFSLAFTVMRTNLHEIERCAELARRVGAESAVFRPLYPVGRARENLDLMPTFSEYNAALGTLSDARLMKADPNCVVDPFSPALRRDTGALIYWGHGCGAGNLVCSISISGDLSPCSFLGPGFRVGNVQDRCLSDLWRDVALTRFRTSAGGQTSDSLPYPQGCRARALWLNGSVDAADPWIDDYSSGERIEKA